MVLHLLPTTALEAESRMSRLARPQIWEHGVLSKQLWWSGSAVGFGGGPDGEAHQESPQTLRAGAALPASRAAVRVTHICHHPFRHHDMSSTFHHMSPTFDRAAPMGCGGVVVQLVRHKDDHVLCAVQ